MIVEYYSLRLNEGLLVRLNEGLLGYCRGQEGVYGGERSVIKFKTLLLIFFILKMNFGKNRSGGW